MNLPIDAVLPDLLTALRGNSRALLVAPPGAGKTTRVAPALLTEQWCADQVLLLVPRRLAARAAAEFMASAMGEAPGQTIGYATRLDSKVAKSTRVIVMTHGVFLSRIEADPELRGVSAVLFDEVHERSLDNDLSLALALDAAAAFREDLRVLAMSATLDVARFQRLLANPPTIVSEGKSFGLDIQHIGREASARIEPQIAAAIRAAFAKHEGSLLAFLPGVAEIERTADALGSIPAGVEVHKLHGGIEPVVQRKALAAPPPGKRKLVLATSIAETSVTLQDVRIVVDSGLARRPRYDRGAGLTRLVTERASRAAVTQRAGRAARQAPGVAIRLWEEAATSSLPAHDPPEIFEADLSRLLLTCLLWGEADPTRLPFLDTPPASALAEARDRLSSLGALDPGGRVTGHGRAIAALPLEPRLAHMLLDARERGFGAAAADVAVLLTERGLGGNDPDLELRWRRWRSDKSPRADGARKLAAGWRRRLEIERCASRRARPRPSAGARLPGSSEPSSGSGRRNPGNPSAAAVFGSTRRHRSRGATGSRWAKSLVMRRARAFFRVPRSARKQCSIFSPTASNFATTPSLIQPPDRSRPTRIRRLGAIKLASGPHPLPDLAAIERALIDGIREHGLQLLPWDERATQLRHRAAFAHRFDPAIAPLHDEMLTDRLDEWLAPLVRDKRKLADIGSAALAISLEQLLGYNEARTLDRLAPPEFASPAGSRHPIDYALPAGPTVEVRAQALFGLSQHPTIANGQVPLILAITSPAGRPIQTTKDLPVFWAGSWRDVAKDMRGRYPKHPWPDDPAAAPPTLRTKRAG